MAERSPGKAKQSSRSKPASATGPAALKAENARLKAELAQAIARIGELEAKHTDVVNRIDWVIDSLHSLVD